MAAQTTNDDPPNKSALPTVDWEAVAKRELATKAAGRSEDVARNAVKIGNAFEDGELSADQVSRFRNSVAAMLEAVESEIIDRDPRFTAFNNGDPYIRNYQMIAGYLDVAAEQLFETMDGATVEVNENATQGLADGETVQVQTPGGTNVKLVPTTGGEQ